MSASGPTPLFANVVPPSESTAGASGGMSLAARGDHNHPRLTSATRVTLDATGAATVTYTRSFAAQPAISLIALNPSGKPVLLEVSSDTQVGGQYTGCTIKGYRQVNLPSVLALLSALLNYDVFSGSAANVQVSVIAIQPSN